MTWVLDDLRTACRRLLRARLFAASTIGIVALAIGRASPERQRHLHDRLLPACDGDARPQSRRSVHRSCDARRAGSIQLTCCGRRGAARRGSVLSPAAAFEPPVAGEPALTRDDLVLA